jgi:hypothetical protein
LARRSVHAGARDRRVVEVRHAGQREAARVAGSRAAALHLDTDCAVLCVGARVEARQGVGGRRGGRHGRMARKSAHVEC